MRFGSLFAGIGGFDLGLERAGMTCAWQVEIDDYCQRVLEKHWPTVPRYGDIKEVDWNDVERPDLVCGGFPCQPVSFAGKGLAQDDERWLLPEIERCLRILRPRYVLLENVPGLLGRGMGDVLATLSSIWGGLTWESLPASAFGAKHRRDRVFLVAHSDRERLPLGEKLHLREIRSEQQTPRWNHAGRCGEFMADAASIRRETGRLSIGAAAAISEPAVDDRDVPDADRSRLEVWGDAQGIREFAATVGARQWSVEPDVGRVANGIPHRVDRLRGLGNAVVPQVAEWIGRRLMAIDAEVPV